MCTLCGVDSSNSTRLATEFAPLDSERARDTGVWFPVRCPMALTRPSRPIGAATEGSVMSVSGAQLEAFGSPTGESVGPVRL